MGNSREKYLKVFTFYVENLLFFFIMMTYFSLFGILTAHFYLEHFSIELWN